MGKTKRKALIEARKKKEARQVFIITVVSTFVLVVLIYFIYIRNS